MGNFEDFSLIWLRSMISSGHLTVFFQSDQDPVRIRPSKLNSSPLKIDGWKFKTFAFSFAYSYQQLVRGELLNIRRFFHVGSAFCETGSSHLKWDLDFWFVCSFVRSILVTRNGLNPPVFLLVHSSPSKFSVALRSQRHLQQKSLVLLWDYWWKKSCTTWDVQNPVNNGVNYLSTGFLPSTVWGGKIWDVKPLGVVIFNEAADFGRFSRKKECNTIFRRKLKHTSWKISYPNQFFLNKQLASSEVRSYRDWWDFDTSQHFVEGSRCHYPQPTSQRRVVLEALEEKDEERALQVQDLDGWEWIWPNSAPVVKN